MGDYLSMVSRNLIKGWNGYDADPPNEKARFNASLFLALIEEADKCKVKPSVIGGIGITYWIDDYSFIYVEFQNDGYNGIIYSYYFPLVNQGWEKTDKTRGVTKMVEIFKDYVRMYDRRKPA